MIVRISKDPVPFVASSDRDKDIQTVFGLRAMKADESAFYRARWNAADKEYNVPAVARAQNSIKVDRESLIGQLDYVQNAGEEGLELKGEEIAEYVTEAIDFLLLQELMLAAQSTAILEAGRKKS